jgi:hypothetical protein
LLTVQIIYFIFGFSKKIVHLSVNFNLLPY